MRSREGLGAGPPPALAGAAATAASRGVPRAPADGMALEAAHAESAGLEATPADQMVLETATTKGSGVGTAAPGALLTGSQAGGASVAEASVADAGALGVAQAGEAPLEAAPVAGVPAGGARRSPWAAHWRLVLLVGLPAAIGVVHVWLVSYHYFVGSFDDDASYLLTAQAILHGAGLDGHLVSGASVVGAYPPGYSFLLIPLLWIWPHTFTPERVWSAVAYAAVFPLLWAYLGRRKVGDVVRFGVLLVLAANPVMATFGSMVMAETSFLVLLLVLLIMVDDWHPGGRSRVLGPRGIGVVVAAAGLVWLKEAGLGIVVGLALWYLLHRDWRKSLAVFGGSALLLMPVLLARHLGGVPLAGSRYSQELGSYYSGGWVDRLTHVLPSSFVHYFTVALPNTVLPHGSPVPFHGGWPILWGVVAGQVTLFTVLGLLIAVWRYRDAAVVMIPVYAAETLMWPEVNERRVILALPVIVTWYVLGVVSAVRWLLSWIGDRTARAPMPASLVPGRHNGATHNGAPRPDHRPGWAALSRPAPLASLGLLAVLAAALIGVPQGAQFGRDYLFSADQSSSHPGGSRYMSILAAVGQPSTVIETDYESTTGLFTGHLTANGAFIASPWQVCNFGAIQQALAADHAGYLLIGTVNKPGVIDNRCLLHQADAHPALAVRLLRTGVDEATVFELIGPGTAHADLSNLLVGSEESSNAPLGYVGNPSHGRADIPGLSTVLTPVNGQSTLSWTWGPNVTLDQVSVGEVGLLHGGSLSGVTLQVQRANGGWVSVADAPGLVGDVGAPYLLGEFPAGTRALAMRLVVRSDAPVVVTDVNALGTQTAPGTPAARGAGAAGRTG